MNRDKCKTCKHFDSFFYSCNLYFKEIYIGEGDFETQPVPIKDVTEQECEYKEIK